MNPRPAGHKLSEFYSGGQYECYETAQSSSAGAKGDYVLEKISRFLPANAPMRLLDYGAGGGGFLLHAQQRGWEVRGFEPAGRGRDACERSGLRVTSDATTLPSGEFGVVTLHHVLEHLEQPIDVLRELRRLLAPSGRLYVEVPNVGSLRARLATPCLSKRLPIDERHRAFPIHLMYYSARTLKAALVAAGWSVEASFTLGMGLDEYFLRDGARSASGLEGQSDRRELMRRPSIRQLLRDAFLGLGLGENVAAIARDIRALS